VVVVAFKTNKSSGTVLSVTDQQAEMVAAIYSHL
jgi:hypothetical protein